MNRMRKEINLFFYPVHPAILLIVDFLSVLPFRFL